MSQGRPRRVISAKSTRLRLSHIISLSPLPPPCEAPLSSPEKGVDGSNMGVSAVCEQDTSANKIRSAESARCQFIEPRLGGSKNAGSRTRTCRGRARQTLTRRHLGAVGSGGGWGRDE
jgi:hypothetical protein